MIIVQRQITFFQSSLSQSRCCWTKFGSETPNTFLKGQPNSRRFGFQVSQENGSRETKRSKLIQPIFLSANFLISFWVFAAENWQTNFYLYLVWKFAGVWSTTILLECRLGWYLAAVSHRANRGRVNMHYGTVLQWGMNASYKRSNHTNHNVPQGTR